MQDWQQLRVLPEEEHARRDVAAVNLACAAGLPGAPTEAEVAECLDRLDYYAQATRHYTEQRMTEFRRDPATYDGSESIFRVLCIVRMVQGAYGIRYNQAKVSDNVRFETPDSFIHGAILGEGGTCATMPLVYVAIGRRLGYPLKLVTAPRHRFCRWDDPGGERFNIEATGDGLALPPDDHYREGRYALPPGVEKQTFFLKSQTRREEMAGFLAQRGLHWEQLGNYREAAHAIIWAGLLASAQKLYESAVVEIINRWRRKLKQMIPPNFPQLRVNMPAVRRFPGLPVAVERDVIAFSAFEALLNQADFQTKVLKPLRDYPQGRPCGIPSKLVINAKEDSRVRHDHSSLD